MDPVELQVLYEQERQKQKEAQARKAALDEAKRPWNQPAADADFEHWSKASVWSLDEAVTLSFGRSPARISWKTIEPYHWVSPFAKAYAEKRDLVLRAKLARQLYEPVIPAFFLAWAKRMQVEVPQELVVAIEARGEQIADWKSRHDELHNDFDKFLATANAFRATANERIDQLKEIVTTLTKERDDLQTQITKFPREEAGAAPKGLSTRERDTVLRLIIGMAIDGYRFDPASARSAVPAEVASALDQLGLSLDVDTVRKWLREAAGLLTQDGTR
jgi:hypothetical protein